MPRRLGANSDAQPQTVTSPMGISDLDPGAYGCRPWNAGNMVGAKRPLKLRDVWAIRFFLDEYRLEASDKSP